MGARVIKVEQPGRGDDTRAWGPPFVHGESAYFLSINRNKESLTLDLKHPGATGGPRRLLDAGRRAGRELPARARWSAWDSATRRSRRGTRGSSTAPSPASARPARGAKSPATTRSCRPKAGLMSITGAAGRSALPSRRRHLRHRQRHVRGAGDRDGAARAGRSGRGQRVDVGMLDSTAALLTYQAGIYFATGATPGRMGNRHPTIVPYETFAASDGEFVVAVGNDDQWRRFCGILGADDLAVDERFATNRARVSHYDTLRPLLVERLRSRTRREWVEGAQGGRRAVRVGARGRRRARGSAARRAPDDRDRRARRPRAPSACSGVPIKLSDTPGGVRTAPPALGQHTDQILRKLTAE